MLTVVLVYNCVSQCSPLCMFASLNFVIVSQYTVLGVIASECPVLGVIASESSVLGVIANECSVLGVICHCK